MEAKGVKAGMKLRCKFLVNGVCFVVLKVAKDMVELCDIKTGTVYRQSYTGFENSYFVIVQ